MEITFVLDWTSFFLGAVSTLVIGFVVVFGIAYKQYKRGAIRKR
jgi:formate hydrogenlyase subunit 3/multisubunit Na+/H+ antiporter MnhD subunit